MSMPWFLQVSIGLDSWQHGDSLPVIALGGEENGGLCLSVRFTSKRSQILTLRFPGVANLEQKCPANR